MDDIETTSHNISDSRFYFTERIELINIVQKSDSNVQNFAENELLKNL